VDESDSRGNTLHSLIDQVSIALQAQAIDVRREANLVPLLSASQSRRIKLLDEMTRAIEFLDAVLYGSI